MLISLLSSIFCSSMVRIQFLTDLDHYLALQLEDNTSSETPFFKSTTLMTLKHRSNYCGRAALRNLTHDTFEFYFCGYKMCYNETDNALVVCELNDDIPTWELQKVDLGRTFLIRCGDACITLRYGRVIMEECKEGVNLDQIVHVIPSEDNAKFFVSDDLDVNSRQKAFEANLMDNDESYRLESINYGKEFAKLPSQRNQRASLHN